MADESKSPDALKLAALQQQVASLQELVEQQNQRDEVQRGAFDQLYAELRQYKEDFIFQAEKPLLLDLLLFYDSLIWFRTSLESGE